jgi:tetratricopeptide (TPR) repeat protein
MTVVQAFGVSPAAFHAASLALHAAAALLLFRFLAGATGLVLPSALAAALFALHPLRVESVAWAAELKDPLSGVFLAAALLAYLAHRRRPGPGRYALLVFWTACGLMTKPTFVTAPFVLLLVDFWPLGRVGLPARGGGAGRGPARATPPGRLVAEKAPLFLLALALVPAALVSQAAAGAVGRVPFAYRVGNAVLACARYLGKTLAPTGLAAVYPHPGDQLAPALVAGAALLLALLAAGAFALRRAVPALLAGWCWFLGVLVPTLGLVQVGAQAMADRYTYLPAMGLSVAAAWGLAAAVRRLRVPVPAAAGAAALLVLALGLGTAAQARLWESNLTLFRHTLAVTGKNWLAAYLYGLGLSDAGRVEEAIGMYREALALNPGSDDVRYALGNALLKLGRGEEAVAMLRGALAAARSPAAALRFHNNLGVALARQGRYGEAAVHFRAALELQPENEGFRKNLARVLADAERAGQAVPAPGR